MRRRLFALLAAAGLAAAAAVQATPAQADTQRKLEIATYNVYLGADLAPLATAPTPQELVRLAGIAYDQMVATDFPARARAISHLLRRDRPDVVGLQEVALWQRGPLGGSLQITYDFLDILLRELATAGLRYHAAAVNTTNTTTLPISATEQASFTDRDVILVQDRVRVTNAQSNIYAAKLVFTTPAGVTFTRVRGWSTVDVGVGHKRAQVRVANTHLEPAPPAIRNAQGQELHTALAQSPLPVVAVGDFNATPTDATGPYGTFATGGYDDAWLVARGAADGFTALQDADLRNVPSKLDRRLDYVFYQPAQLSAVWAELIGEELRDRTSTGLWPSDHAGLVVTLRLNSKGTGHDSGR
ncbi:endonuclease/exonuclease/phosphatase family protein [Catellatospora sichuanensis]|uniref:endonuclease/exonuclease/phosphatase family protein n=1 Tax=Catellatospora sichuanensis TaxID=1969805 RepID=UPI001182C7B7|nr:endonuclease/exonuclease/phosphatase family protein [Catellatospora sichuanensis]